MTYWSNKLKSSAEDIFKLDGVLSVTVGRLGIHDCHTIGDHSAIQIAAIELLEKNGLDEVTVVISDCRILVERWRETACAVTVERRSPVNKSVRRKIRRVGKKYDPRDPDDTALGKALGELERSDPEVAKAVDNYERVKLEIIDGKRA